MSTLLIQFTAPRHYIAYLTASKEPCPDNMPKSKKEGATKTPQPRPPVCEFCREKKTRVCHNLCFCQAILPLIPYVPTIVRRTKSGISLSQVHRKWKGMQTHTHWVSEKKSREEVRVTALQIKNRYASHTVLLVFCYTIFPRYSQTYPVPSSLAPPPLIEPASANLLNVETSNQANVSVRSYNVCPFYALTHYCMFMQSTGTFKQSFYSCTQDPTTGYVLNSMDQTQNQFAPRMSNAQIYPPLSETYPSLRVSRVFSTNLAHANSQ